METKGQVRQFDTGATRDTDQGKYDYEAFFSPRVIERRAQYMHKHRHQADGTLRDGDNWQKGIPRDQFMKSLLRHAMDLWLAHRDAKIIDFEETLCAIAFNTEGYLHEFLIGRDVGKNQAGTGSTQTPVPSVAHGMSAPKQAESPAKASSLMARLSGAIAPKTAK